MAKFFVNRPIVAIVISIIMIIVGAVALQGLPISGRALVNQQCVGRLAVERRIWN